MNELEQQELELKIQKLEQELALEPVRLFIYGFATMAGVAAVVLGYFKYFAE